MTVILFLIKAPAASSEYRCVRQVVHREALVVSLQCTCIYYFCVVLLPSSSSETLLGVVWLAISTVNMNQMQRRTTRFLESLYKVHVMFSSGIFNVKVLGWLKREKKHGDYKKEDEMLLKLQRRLKLNHCLFVFVV